MNKTIKAVVKEALVWKKTRLKSCIKSIKSYEDHIEEKEEILDSVKRNYKKEIDNKCKLVQEIKDLKNGR